MDVHESYAPFAHVPGRYEWCRIRTTTHGVFDCFIVLGKSTAVPATVYVDTEHGAKFMADRFPQSTCIRVPYGHLAIVEDPDQRGVHGSLRADSGPVRVAVMHLRASDDATLTAVPYGGRDQPCWGAPLSCEGLDLNWDGHAHGFVRHEDGRDEVLAEAAIVTAGSTGVLRPLALRQGHAGQG